MSRWSPFLTVLALSLPAPACSSADDSGAPNENGDGSSAPTERYSLAFSEANLTLRPGVARSVGVRVTPPTAGTVRLSLVGEAGDAFLDTGVALTDDSGEGSFSLTAPTSARAFRVLASWGSASAELPVGVSDDFTTVVVWPLYSGNRAVDSWVGTVTPGASCDDGEDDGPIFADGDKADEATVGWPSIKDIPVGVKLRVTVRAGHFAGGCADTRATLGLPFNHTVLVSVKDRPIQLGGANIQVKLGLDSGDGWALAWSDVIDAIVDRFVSRKSDSAALLDAMYEACHPTAAPEFVQARAKAGWDARLASAFGNLLGVGTLTHRLRSFLTAGVGADGTTSLEGTLVSGQAPGGKAKLAFSSIGGVAATAAAFPSSIDVTWTAGTGDRVLFGGSAEFAASSLAAALGQAVARKEVPSATTLPGALAQSLSCHEVASVLVDSSGGEYAYGSCGEACLVSLCTEALQTMWTRALSGSSTKSKLELSASGAVKALSDGAVPLEFKGTWIGAASIGGRQARVSGAATGSPPRASVP